jgi:hypothetical protein
MRGYHRSRPCGQPLTVSGQYSGAQDSDTIPHRVRGEYMEVKVGAHCWQANTIPPSLGGGKIQTQDPAGASNKLFKINSARYL